jgi:hypothetical protein
MEEVLHSCGHRQLVNLEAAGRSRDRKRGYLERNGRCHACTEIQFGALNRAAARKADADGLPRLDGTESQVAAATTVRERFRLQLEMAVTTVLAGGTSECGVQLVREYFESQIRRIGDAGTYMNWRHWTWVVLIHNCLADASEEQRLADDCALFQAFMALHACSVGSELQLMEDGRLVLAEVGKADRGGDVPVAL